MLTQDLLYAFVEVDGLELNAGHYVAHPEHLLDAYNVLKALGDLSLHDVCYLAVLWGINVTLSKRTYVYICFACKDALHDATIYRASLLEEIYPNWKLMARVRFVLATSRP